MKEDKNKNFCVVKFNLFVQTQSYTQLCNSMCLCMCVRVCVCKYSNVG